MVELRKYQLEVAEKFSNPYNQNSTQRLYNQKEFMNNAESRTFGNPKMTGQLSNDRTPLILQNIN